MAQSNNSIGEITARNLGQDGEVNKKDADKGPLGSANKEDAKAVKAVVARFLWSKIEALRPGKTQHEIAEELGLSQSAVSELSSGITASWPTVAAVGRLVPVGELLIGAGKLYANERLKDVENEPVREMPKPKTLRDKLSEGTLPAAPKASAPPVAPTARQRTKPEAPEPDLPRRR